MRKIFSLLMLCMLALVPTYAQTLVFTPSDAPTEQGWAVNTNWYRIYQGKNHSYLSAANVDKDGKFVFSDTQAPALNEDKALWCLVGSVENGFAFYNKAAGVNQVLSFYDLDVTQTENKAAYAKMDAKAASGAIQTYFYAHLDGTTPDKAGCFKLEKSGNSYWNNMDTRLVVWNSEYGLYGWEGSATNPIKGGDQGSNFYFEEVSMLDGVPFVDLPSSSWKVSTTSWQNDGDYGPVSCVIDNNPASYWHSDYSGDHQKLPHTLTFDLGTAQTFTHWGYMPRQGNGNGRVKGYTFAVSDDNSNWKLIKSGELPGDKGDALIWTNFNKSVTARYVKLTIHSNYNNNVKWATMSEFKLGNNGNSTAALVGLPDFSAESAPAWYRLRFSTDGKFFLEDQGNNQKMLTAERQENDAQKWMFYGDENDFIMKSKQNNYVCFKEGRFFTTNNKANASHLAFIQHKRDGKSLELKVVGHDKTMNQNSGGKVSGHDLCEWEANTDVNGFTLISTLLADEPVFSDAQTTKWYFIQFKRGGMAIVDKGLDKAVRTDKLDPSENKLWKLVGNINNFQIVNQQNHYIVLKGSDNEVNKDHLGVSEIQDEKGFKLIPTTHVSSRPAWEIQRNGHGGAFNQDGGFGAGKAIGFWSQNGGDPNNPLLFVEPETVEYADYMVDGDMNFKPSNNVTLWYRQPATLGNSNDNWMEYTLPIGNGQLGASIFGGVYKDEIQFNEKTLWSGRSTDNGIDYGDYENFGSVFAQNLNEGEFTFGTQKPVKNYVRGLDLKNSKAFVKFENAEGVKYTREYISSFPGKVIAVRYKASQAGKLNLRFYMEPGALERMKLDKPDQGIEYAAPTYVNAGGTFSGKLQTVSYNARFKVVATNQGSPVTPTTGTDGVTVQGADEVLLILTGATNFDPKPATYVTKTAAEIATDVESLVNTAADQTWEALYKAHFDDFNQFFDRCELNLDGVQNVIPTNQLIDDYNSGNGTHALMLEQLYFAYGRYLEISSSRGVILPSNLQGIWNNNSETAWNGDIHANINVQMNYWPAEPTNLSEMHVPFLDYIVNMSTNPNHKEWAGYAQTAGQEGWTCYTENNIFGGVGDFAHNYVIANAWYCTHLWQHYRYTLNLDYLEKAFPAMWSASRFWVDRLKLAADGTYECPMESSPEQGPKQDGVAHAQQLVWDLFDNTLKAIDALGDRVPKNLVTTELLNKLKDRFAHLDNGLHTETYQPTSDNGWLDNNNGIVRDDILLREWKYSNFTAGTDGHRHLSHLMCVYPFNQITPVSGKLFQAARNSLILRHDASTGWSMGWKINLWARMLDGDHAREILKLALRHHSVDGGGVYYNLYDAHTPFQIDGNFGACSGMAEMLMQSQNDVIDILPALPTAWVKGSVRGLKAVGDFTVDIAWDKLKPTTATIRSNKGQPMVVRYKGISNAQVTVTENPEAKVTVIDANTIQIDAKANQTATITFEVLNTKGSFTIKAKEGYGTYYTDHAFTMPAGVKGSTVEGVSTPDAAGIATLATPWQYLPTQVVPAKTALLLKGDKAGTYSYDIAESAEQAPTNNLLKGSLNVTSTEQVSNTKYYYLTYSMVGAEGSAVKTLGFFWGAANGGAFINGANKAYLAVPATVGAQAKGYRFSDEATGVEEILTGNTEDVIYNLAGVRMNIELDQLTKGVYIVNGKKVIVK